VLKASEGSRHLTVAIVDDHDAIHAGVTAWFAQADPRIEVIASYAAIAPLLADYPHRDPALDVVVLDLELTSRQPDFGAVAQLHDAGHRVLVHSHLTHDEVILTCLDRGACCYVAKTEGREHLINGVRAAARDIGYIGPRMANAIANDNRHGRPDLTAREREVLVAWFQTENKDLVSKRLFLSPSTVNTHLQRIRAKYAATGRPANSKATLLARAVQDGIVGIDSI